MTFTVIPCGAQKLPGWHSARDLYVGPHFRAGLLAAEALGHPYGILSGRYGLITPGLLIESYENPMATHPDAAYMDRLRAQVRNLAGHGPLVLLLPAKYARVITEAAPDVASVRPFDQAGCSIGKQRYLLARMRREGRVVTAREAFLPGPGPIVERSA